MSDDLSGFSLFELFQDEARLHVATLERELVALETGAADPARLEALMRAAHSIKGAARIVGLEAAVRVAHGLEDVFVAAQRGELTLRPAAIDVLLAAADLLHEFAEAPASAAPAALAARQAEVEGIVERVRAVVRGAAAPPPSEPASTGPAAPVPAAPQPALPALAPAASPTAAPAPSAVDDGAVRVGAQSLSRMLAYAGESLVEARRLAAHVRGLDALRRTANRLVTALEEAEGGGRGAEVSLATARGLAPRLRALLTRHDEALEESARRSEDLAGRLYGEVLASRMRPFDDALTAFPRLVRDVARELGRRVRFVIEGREVLVDRDILERLEAPLGHLLRNALDHGVEGPEERTAAGKLPEGTVRLAARHRGGMLEVEVRDDGRGVDLAVLRERIVERGLISAEIARTLIAQELLEFLFLPGFSTRREVTELSGRGVGLDVVQRLAQEAGGTARVESSPGTGTCFTLVLPITRSVVRAALVEVDGEPYAFPLTRIERLVRLEEGEIASTGGRQHYLHEGRTVGLVAASEALGLAAPRRAGGPVHAVQISAGGDRWGLAVDRFLGEQDLVVRPLDPRLRQVANISAASVLESGDPVLIVDTEDLVRSVDGLFQRGRSSSLPAPAGEGPAPRARKRVLVVDDSRTVREVEKGLLTSRGYQVDVAVDGTDGWNAVRSSRYDLVITDVDMPRMNGIELVRLIKADAELGRTPVMIVSYKDREDDRRRGLEAGADRYVTKSAFQESGWIEAVVALVGEP